MASEHWCAITLYNRFWFSCSTIPYLFLGSTKYVLGKKEANDCETGSTISDPSECERACGDLNFQKGTLWNGGVCFVQTNEECGMNNKHRLCKPGVFGLYCPVICKISGSWDYSTFTVIK